MIKTFVGIVGIDWRWKPLTISCLLCSFWIKSICIKSVHAGKNAVIHKEIMIYHINACIGKL